MSQQSFDLAALPLDSALNGVVAWPSTAAGRPALHVELSDATRAGRPDIDFIDQPTFVQLPIRFRDGTIRVDILSRLASGAPDYARGFAGLAYRIAEARDQFEAVYLRPLNGRKLAPPPPRDRRAVQYFAYPDWRYEQLRAAAPDGRYEAGADIGPDDWTTLALHISGQRLRVEVDGATVLSLDETKAAPAFGGIGLFVDIGTEAYFANLSVTPAETV